MTRAQADKIHTYANRTANDPDMSVEMRLAKLYSIKAVLSYLGETSMATDVAMLELALEDAQTEMAEVTEAGK